MYNEDYRYYPNYHYIHWTDISTWDFKECNCAKTKHIKGYFTQPRFFAKVEFMDNAKEVLFRLKDKYEIVIVSMGIQPNLFGKSFGLKIIYHLQNLSALIWISIKINHVLICLVAF